MVLHRAVGVSIGQRQLQRQGRQQPCGTRHLSAERNDSIATSADLPCQRLVIVVPIAVNHRAVIVQRLDVHLSPIR